MNTDTLVHVPTHEPDDDALLQAWCVLLTYFAQHTVPPAPLKKAA